ncbi:MAG: two-component regulator propeller domain-containing protein, partial [Sediminibacterium sp.]
MLVRISIFLYFLTQTIFGIGQNKIGGIGQWREHFNNHSIIQISIAPVNNGESKIIGASTEQIFSISAKNNIELEGKSTGLHDVSIACTAWDEEQAQLIVAYNNSNIDIIKGDQVYSITDLLLSNLYASKKINQIYILHQWALLSTDFGIVVIDLIKHEIKDTWFPNNHRQAAKTIQVISTTNLLYAVTEDGIWTCPIKNNWITLGQWQNNSDFNNLSISKLTQYDGIVYGANSNTIFQLPSKNPFATIYNTQIKKISALKIGLYVSVSDGRFGKLLKINGDKSITNIIDSNYLSNPVDFLLDQNNIWVADSNNGLLLKNTTVQWLPIGGPDGNINGQISIDTKKLIAPLGFKNTGFSIYNESGWKTIHTANNQNLPSCFSSATDPVDGSIWLTTNDGLFKYNIEKASIASVNTNNYKGFFSNIQFSSDGTLWMLLEEQGILIKQNNTWKLLTPPNSISMIDIHHMYINQQGQAWMIAPKYQGILVFNPNSSGDKWSIINTYNNNLPSSTVTSIMEDNNGKMWVCTNNGIG